MTLASFKVADGTLYVYVVFKHSGNYPVLFNMYSLQTEHKYLYKFCSVTDGAKLSNNTI